MVGGELVGGRLFETTHWNFHDLLLGGDVHVGGVVGRVHLQDLGLGDSVNIEG